MSGCLAIPTSLKKETSGGQTFIKIDTLFARLPCFLDGLAVTLEPVKVSLSFGIYDRCKLHEETKKESLGTTNFLSGLGVATI